MSQLPGTTRPQECGTFCQWRRQVRQIAKDRFYKSHQWTTIWIEVVVTVVSATAAGFGWGALAFWQTAIPGVAVGAVLLIGFLTYDMVRAPYWLTEQKDAEIARLTQSRDAQLTEQAQQLLSEHLAGYALRYSEITERIKDGPDSVLRWKFMIKKVNKLFDEVTGTLESQGSLAQSYLLKFRGRFNAPETNRMPMPGDWSKPRKDLYVQALACEERLTAFVNDLQRAAKP